MDCGSHFGLRRCVLLVLAVLVLGLAGGLANSFASSSSPSPAPGKVVLRIGWTTEPDNLNPFIGFANVSYEYFALNYDLLFRMGANGQPSLDLAAEFPTKQNGGISADGKVWTIHIRPNAKWDDGVPLTAADVAFTYNYIVDNQMANMAVSTVGISSAKALDPTTVQIVCSRPKADMEYLFIPILPKHIWSHISPQSAQTSFANNPPIIGSGPYQVVAWKKGNYLLLKRNPYYWGAKPAVDEIYCLIYQNPQTMVSDLKAGVIDAAMGIQEAAFAQLKSQGTQSGITAISYYEYNWDYLNFNCYTGPQSKGNPVLLDWRFRHALGYAIDQPRICRIAFAGLAVPGTTLLNPNTWSNPDYHWNPPAGESYTFDLAKANQLLDQAGYQRGPGGYRLYQGKPISLRLWATTDSSPEQIEAKLIAGWFGQLGLKIKLAVMDYDSLWANVMNFKGNTFTPDFDAYISSWQGYTDPGQDMSCFTTAQIGTTNEPAWSNAEFDRLNTQQAETLDKQKRQPILFHMQQIMYEQAPWLVLTYPYNLQAYNTARWTGWTRIMNGNGPAFFGTPNIDSYLNLRPKVAVTSARTKSTTLVWVAVLIVAAVVVAVVVLRRRRRAEEV